jgi:hypothetical protein
VGLSAVAAVNVLTPTERIQKALDALQAGEYLRAERAAARLATSGEEGARRAWIIAAAALERQGRYGEAERAYRRFLPACDGPLQRGYVAEQMRRCRLGADRSRQPRPLSATLSPDQRKELSAVDDDWYTESSEHFVVEARNSPLAKLVARQAEVALTRICRIVLSGSAYPHAVAVHVWPDAKEYAAHATSAAEWSGGAFVLQQDANGQLVRRIDLTQLDGEGQFDAAMLDRVLPHEMCHLVLTEFFGDASCPLAVNEGLAMLAEATADNGRVLLAGAALGGEGRIPLGELLLADRPTGENARVFYAESFSLMSFLHSRLSAGQFQEMLVHLKGGLALEEALQRALYLPADEAFLDRLAGAWAAEAVRQLQFLQALDATEKS